MPAQFLSPQAMAAELLNRLSPEAAHISAETELVAASYLQLRATESYWAAVLASVESVDDARLAGAAQAELPQRA